MEGEGRMKGTGEWVDVYWRFYKKKSEESPKQEVENSFQQENNNNNSNNCSTNTENKHEIHESIPLQDIPTDVSWKEVCWDVAREAAAQQLLQDEVPVEAWVVQKHQREASDYWETFYQLNKNKFFKERHYLH